MDNEISTNLLRVIAAQQHVLLEMLAAERLKVDDRTVSEVIQSKVNRALRFLTDKRLSTQGKEPFGFEAGKRE